MGLLYRGAPDCDFTPSSNKSNLLNHLGRKKWCPCKQCGWTVQQARGGQIDGRTTRYRKRPTEMDEDNGGGHTAVDVDVDMVVVAEKDVQSHLSKQFPGSRCEVAVAIGRVDLVVDNLKLIIEIKRASNWMHGLGQIVAYSRFFPGYQRVLQLFGPFSSQVDLETIVESCKIENVAVWTMPFFGDHP